MMNDCEEINDVELRRIVGGTNPVLICLAGTIGGGLLATPLGPVPALGGVLAGWAASCQ